MTFITSIGTANTVTQYQQSVRVIIEGADAADLDEVIFAGFSMPFSVVSPTEIDINIPGTVKKGYLALYEAYANGVTGRCTFNITHPVKVPPVEAVLDDNSLLSGIGNDSKRYVRVDLPSQFELDVPNITSTNITGDADSLISARFGTQIGQEQDAIISVLNNDGTEQSYPVTLVAGANDPGSNPIIAFNGGSPKQINLGQSFVRDAYATDVTEGDISSRITQSGTVNVNVEGDYPLIYSITNTFGRTASVTQIIRVKQDMRYEIQLLASLDQNVQGVTRTYPFGYVIAENGTRSLVVVQNISLTNGETVISQSDVSFGSFAQMAKSGTTKVSVILIDAQNNAASLPINIPLIAIPL